MYLVVRAVRNLGSAVAAGAYWMAACWVCFALSGNDPVDAVTLSYFGGQQVASLAVFGGFIAVFAVLLRVLRGRRSGAKGTLGFRFAWAAVSAGYWIAAFYLATGLLLGERFTEHGVEAAAPPWAVWLVMAVFFLLYALLSAVFKRTWPCKRVS